MQKVYVVTKAKPMMEEHYVTVKATKKEAEKVIRAEYPNAQKDSTRSGFDSYACKNRIGDWIIMFVREETI